MEHQNIITEKQQLMERIFKFSKDYDQVINTYIFDRKSGSMQHFSTHPDLDLWTLFNSCKSKETTKFDHCVEPESKST